MKLMKNFKKTLRPLFWMGFNCLQATEPFRGGSLLFTSRFQQIPGTHQIYLQRMTGWVDLGAALWFWTWDLWIGSPVPQPLGHSYIGDEYKDLIDNIFKSRLRDGDFCLTKIDNHKLALTNIVNNYLEKKLLIWMIDCLILINPLKICQILTIEYIWS